MKSLKSMGKTKNKDMSGVAQATESPSKTQMRAPTLKLALQDRAIECIKSGNSDGLIALTAEGASDVAFLNKLHTKSGMHPLAVAADESNLEAMEIMLKAGADVNMKDKKGMSAFLYAASQLGEEIIESLVLHGATIDAINDNTGETAAHIAAKRKFNAIVKLLDLKGVPMDQQDLRHETPLSISLKLENFELCRFLLTRDARIDVTNAMGDTALLRSAFDGRFEASKFILDNGGDLHHRNSNGETALLIAVRHGNKQLVDVLLQRGARVNDADNLGKSPLMVAVMANKRPMAQLLLAQEALDINLTDAWGYSALSLICICSQPDMALLQELLAVPGLLVDQADRGFDTALIHAARLGHMGVIQLLLDAKADPYLANIDNYTAEEVLPEGLREAFREELRRRGLSAEHGGSRRQGDKPHWMLDLNRRKGK